MRDWARSTGNPWYILSAKHGLLDPMREIEEYNEVGLSVEQCEQIATELSDKGVAEVLITAGKKYTDPLTPELERLGVDVIEVCRGLQIGERMAELKKRTQENV